MVWGGGEENLLLDVVGGNLSELYPLKIRVICWR